MNFQNGLHLQAAFVDGILFSLCAGSREPVLPFSHCPPFQSKHHVAGALKKSDVLFPAYAAFTVLQADELLLHFPAADRADPVAGPHATTAFPCSDYTISGRRVHL